MHRREVQLESKVPLAFLPSTLVWTSCFFTQGRPAFACLLIQAGGTLTSSNQLFPKKLERTGVNCKSVFLEAALHGAYSKAI
ncbi:hypothetical protein Y1Q_0004995 [Alligator mississippiensis]|uniref:Uncharacterized protein n=1 Tax=Alligator mississippiensis TaxID=8496 RepID=A0A151LZE6_ALLMI|nr:hypothetical protein Y1Q_0004995 [Alligator mississippiensis]